MRAGGKHISEEETVEETESSPKRNSKCVRKRYNWSSLPEKGIRHGCTTSSQTFFILHYGWNTLRTLYYSEHDFSDKVRSFLCKFKKWFIGLTVRKHFTLSFSLSNPDVLVAIVFISHWIVRIHFQERTVWDRQHDKQQ